MPSERRPKIGDIRYHSAEKRRDAFIMHLGTGCSPREAARLVGVSMSAYAKWRQTYPEFRARADAAKAAGKERGQIVYNGEFANFRKLYLGMDTYSHQMRMVEALNEVKPREVIMVNIHPEAGKTSTVVDYICWVLARDPRHRFSVISRSQTHARKLVGQVKQRMTNNRQFADYIARWGPFNVDGQERQGKPWRSDYFTLYKNDADEKDYNLHAMGWTSAAYGSRIDTLIVDDVQDVQNLGQTDDILGTLRQTFFTRGLGMRTVIIGTRIAPGDVYEQLIEKGIVSKHISLPAVNHEGEPMCPEWWDRMASQMEITPKQFLELIRAQVGEDVWWASYMQRPNANELATFTEEMLNASKDRLRNVGRSSEIVPVVTSLDPALGGGCAIVSAAMHNDRFEILDAQTVYNLSRVEDIINLVQSHVIAYQTTKLIVEINSLQRAIAFDDRLRELSRTYGFQIFPHTTTRNKADPILGVAMMASSFLKEELRIPYGNDYTQKRMDALIGQLRAWRANVPTKLIVQDLVMALWMGWRHWMELRRSWQVDPTGWKRAGLPWQPSPLLTRSN